MNNPDEFDPVIISEVPYEASQSARAAIFYGEALLGVGQVVQLYADGRPAGVVFASELEVDKRVKDATADLLKMHPVAMVGYEMIGLRGLLALRNAALLDIDLALATKFSPPVSELPPF